MLPQVEHLLDPLQFAYRTKRSVEDASLSMLNVILEHLERRGSYARILFVEFSSAFNTIQSYLMIRKRIDLGVGKQFVMLVQFPYKPLIVCECQWRVFVTCVYLHRSSSGWVLSLFLYTMYTNSCRSAYSNNHYFKYVDDTAVVGLLSEDETDYRSDIDYFVSWRVANCLELNVVKTKELVIDFRSGVHHPIPVNINGQHIEIVHSYKYLGTTIDDKLRWDDNAMNLYKKGQQRLYFLRKRNALHIDRNILFGFHDSFVKSVMTFGLVCLWGNLSVKNREKLNRIYTISFKIAKGCIPDTSLEQLYK